MAEFPTNRIAAARNPWRLRMPALAGLILFCCPASAQDAQWRQLTLAERQFYTAGKYQQAMQTVQEALRIAGLTYGPESRQVATSLNDLAMALEGLDRRAEAEPLYRRALAINEKTLGSQSPEVATGMNNLGVLYLDLGRLPEAKDLLVRALAIREKALGPNDPATVGSAGNLGMVLTAQGNYVEAEPLELRALAVDQKALGPEDAAVATDLNNAGLVYSYEAKYAQAESLYTKALSIHLKLFGNENPLVAGDLSLIGSLNAAQHKYALAEATYRRALAIDQKAAAGKGLAIASDLNKLAGLFHNQGRYVEAEPLYRQALEIDLKALGPEDPEVAGVLNSLATLYSAQGRFPEAEPVFQRALAIRQKAKGAEHPSVALTLSGLALLKKDQGQYADAEALYKRALAIDEKALGPENPQVARILDGLGNLYMDVVQVATAAPLFQRALAIHEKNFGPDHPDVADDLNNIALVYDAGGNPEKAAPLYERVIAIHQKVSGATGSGLVAPLLNLGSLRQREGNFAAAESLEKRGLSILEASEGPDSPNTRAAVLDLAITYYGSGRTELAATYFDRGLASLAKQVDASFTYMSERERLQFLATAPGAFPLLFSFALNNRERDASLAGKMYDALLWEKGLIASNSAALRAKILDSGDPQAVALFDQLTAKRAQLAQLASAPPADSAEWRKAMAQLDQEANGIETALVKRSAALAESKALARITWRDVQKALKPDEAAVEYIRFPAHDGIHWVHADAYAAAVLTPSGNPRLLLLGNAQKLEAEPLASYRAGVARTRGIAAAGGSGSSAPPAGPGTGAAYAAFWKPLEESLGGAKRVYVAADGILNQVPIGLFSDPEGKLLLEKYDLRVVNSTKDLLRPQHGAGGKTALVIGNPSFNLSEAAQREAASKLKAPAIHRAAAAAGTGPALRGSEGSDPLPPLPATQAEAEAVALALKNAGWQVELDTGSMALEEAVGRARGPRVVHLATHGFFLANPPQTADPPPPGAQPARQPALRDPMLRSGLFFAGADRIRAGQRPAADLEDGVLTAYEATQLHLQGTELVVLSACETGLGQQANGEGVFGLRRGLQEAGAESVLMSMWPVPDRETQELMTLFYRQWLGGLDSHEALRQAQLKERDTVRQRYGRDLPYYWGAFVLVGR